MILGFDEKGSGDALVFVHGFPVDRRMWQAQLDGLADGRRVVAVDLRGRGKSPETTAGGMDDYADDVAATIKSLGVDKADIAGLSLGGYVLFALWRRHPEVVRSLILIDTKAGEDPPEAKEGRETTAALVTEKGTTALIEGLFPKIFARQVSEDVKDAVRPMFEESPSDATAADALAMKDRPDSTADLGTITVPVLVIHGEEDQLMPVEGSRDMATKIPGSQFVSIPRAGHFAPMENPEAVNEAIKSFLTAR